MPRSRPNILWICTDQQRVDTLGCYGNTMVTTPNIDRLAANGIRFERAYCQSPICTPSRASFLTGRYPRTTRCRANGQTMPADEVLVTRLLSDAGYICGLSGKLHIAACNPSASPGTEKRLDDGYDIFHWSHHPTADWPTNEYSLWLREKGLEYRTESHVDSDYVQIGMPEEAHQTTWCAEKAINFIEANAMSDHPWLFSVNIFDPHHAFDPPKAYLEPYLDRLDEIPLPNYRPGELENKPSYQRNDHKQAYNTPGYFPFDEMDETDHRLITAAYWAMTDLIDAQVGRMLDALERTGQRDETIVIFMSDHGEMLGDHGIYLKGPYFYEPAANVPLIFNYPGTIERGVSDTALTELVDLAPTLLDAAGLPRHPGMQGHSLWPILTGQPVEQPRRDSVYSEYYNAMPWHQDPVAYATMLRTDTHKLVVVHGLDTGELYELAADPSETDNLWDDPDMQLIKIDLLKRLCDRMAWTTDPLPVRQSVW